MASAAAAAPAITEQDLRSAVITLGADRFALVLAPSRLIWGSPIGTDAKPGCLRPKSRMQNLFNRHYGATAMSRRRRIAFIAAGLLLAMPMVVETAEAGAYSTNSSPTLQETCHDLHVAFLAVASANQSAPNIGRARMLDQSAVRACRINPRGSVQRLQAALHLVTPH